MCLHSDEKAPVEREGVGVIGGHGPPDVEGARGQSTGTGPGLVSLGGSSCPLYQPRRKEAILDADGDKQEGSVRGSCDITRLGEGGGRWFEES